MNHIRIRELWQKACEFDGVDSTSSFVVFSDRNDAAREYNRAMNAILTAKRQRENDYVVSHIH